MGFLDSVTSAVNRGTASMQRTGRSAQLKMQISDLMKQRKEMAAQLGANLYEATKDDPVLRQGREALYDAIAQIDLNRAAMEAEVAELEAAAQAQQQAAMMYRCHKCGSSVNATDMFCSGCGTPVQEIIAAATAAAVAPVAVAGPSKTCASCGAQMAIDDMFCMTCGAKVQVEETAPEAPTA